MRFNRVLLLAASVNLAVLAMLFTISCSGDKGAKGKDADFGQCAIEDGKLVCGGTVIGDLPGGGPGDPNDPNSGAYCLAISGTKVQCGDKILDFGVAGCNVKEFMERRETVLVNCSGEEFGICFGQPYNFDTHFCDLGTVQPLPVCGGDKTEYNPNKGQACENGREVLQCSDKEFYWTLSSTPNATGGIYNKCGVDPRYRECKNSNNEVIGVFFIGQPRTVSDVITTSTNSDDFITSTLSTVTEYEGTEYCSNPNSTNAKIESCENGYTPDAGSNANDLRAFTSCKLKANYAECYSAGGFVAAFDARTHICDKRNTTSAKVESCADLNGGFTEFVPKPGKEYTSQLERQMKGYNECGIDPDYGPCLTTNSVAGIYHKATQVCKNAGNTDAKVETCGTGYIPDTRNRECIFGETECEDRFKKTGGGYWDPEKLNCFYNAQAACFEKNGTPANCRYNADGKWTINGVIGGTDCSYTSPTGTNKFGTGTGVGSWTYSLTNQPGTSSAFITKISEDKFFDQSANNGKGACYDNLKTWCDAGNGLWTGTTGDPNENGTGGSISACKGVGDLNEFECVSNKDKGYVWSGLQTPGNVDKTNRWCSVNELVAKQTCEARGKYRVTVGTIPGIYGWSAPDKECVRLYNSSDLIKSFKNQASCEGSGYYWDNGSNPRCYVNIDNAESACAVANGKICYNGTTALANCNSVVAGNTVSLAGLTQWDGIKCSGSSITNTCETGSFSSCGTQPACTAAGFYWDPYNIDIVATVPTNVPKCKATEGDCENKAGSELQVCKDAKGTDFNFKCTAANYPGRALEVTTSGLGLVVGDCVTEDICNRSNGYYSGWLNVTPSGATGYYPHTCVTDCDINTGKKTGSITVNSIVGKYCADGCAEFGNAEVIGTVGLLTTGACIANSAACTGGKYDFKAERCGASCSVLTEIEVGVGGVTVGTTSVAAGNCVSACPGTGRVDVDGLCYSTSACGSANAEKNALNVCVCKSGYTTLDATGTNCDVIQTDTTCGAGKFTNYPTNNTCGNCPLSTVDGECGCAAGSSPNGSGGCA